MLVGSLGCSTHLVVNGAPPNEEFGKVMSKFNAASALVKSFDSLTSSAATLLLFIIFVTNDQLLLDFGPEMNESNDSKTATAIDSTSLNMLTVSLLNCSFLRELKVLLFSKALRSVFFITFLEAKNFLISLVNSISPLRLLHEAPVEDLNMASNSEIRGCCLEGKLLDRTQKVIRETEGISSSPHTCTFVEDSVGLLSTRQQCKHLGQALSYHIYVGMASTPAHCTQGRGSDQPIRIYIAPRETRDIWYVNASLLRKLRRETLVLIKCLNKDSRICSKTASTFANSFTTSSSQPTLLLCMILETRDQPPSLDCVFGPEINDNNDSNDARVTASTSLKTITKAVISSSLVEGEAELFDSAPFKLFKAFWIAFFTTFLEAESNLRVKNTTYWKGEMVQGIRKMAMLAKAPSALANSLHSMTPSQATLLDFITLETNDQLFALDDFDSETKETIDSKTLKVINSTSLNMLTISAVCSSFLRDEVLNLDLFSMALESAFFIIFLELKNFLTSLERLISPPCFLRIAD
ncbi:hypothetical protein G4B88_008607 [Cannabis sativa]|uniref:Uncharacterized protein n=1 Tax=Cannabis sativa TaxID=3483 RepID=A0A7J6FC75_CANSA|nr:hypothetical protein G4B88_008607 [Cannabis sativa]